MGLRSEPTRGFSIPDSDRSLIGPDSSVGSRVVHSVWLESAKSIRHSKHRIQIQPAFLLRGSLPNSVNQYLKNSAQAVNKSDYSMVVPACSCMLVQHGVVVHMIEPAAVLLLKPLAG